jgi:hypothetical protein
VEGGSSSLNDYNTDLTPKGIYWSIKYDDDDDDDDDD